MPCLPRGLAPRAALALALLPLLLPPAAARGLRGEASISMAQRSLGPAQAWPRSEPDYPRWVEEPRPQGGGGTVASAITGNTVEARARARAPGGGGYEERGARGS